MPIWEIWEEVKIAFIYGLMISIFISKIFGAFSRDADIKKAVFQKEKHLSYQTSHDFFVM